jgi:hypothetical protein
MSSYFTRPCSTYCSRTLLLMMVLADSVALLQYSSPGAGAMFELTDEAFARVRPLLPANSRGKP